MTDIVTTEPDDFDLGTLRAVDEAELVIKNPKTQKPTTWIWTFYGPGHPKTVVVADRVSREFLAEAREKEQARVNGKKWKADEEDVGDVRAKNIRNIVDRIKTFSPVKLNGKLIEFSPDAARELLLDPSLSWLYSQVSEYLREDASFIPPSAKA